MGRPRSGCAIPQVSFSAPDVTVTHVRLFTVLQRTSLPLSEDNTRDSRSARRRPKELSCRFEMCSVTKFRAYSVVHVNVYTSSSKRLSYGNS
jgi:hypothetical protein